MTQNISGFGLVVNVVASITFPVGLQITQFADDSDPLDLPSTLIADAAMGLNGDLVFWKKAQKLPMVLQVISNSIDDQNLQILADANRVAQGKRAVSDIITATIAYPDGTFINLSKGLMVDANFGRSVSLQMRLKTKSYGFIFEQKA